MKKVLLLFLIVLFFISACEKKIPPISRLPNDAIILAFGDSLTHGTGVEPEQSYPSILSKLINRKIIEAGVPGEVTEEGLKRLPALIEHYNPDLVILCHGGNDLLRHLNEEKTKENLRAMVKILKERGISVILIGVPKPGFILSIPAFYKEIAEEFHIPYEGEILKDILSKNSLKSDPIHPNANGYNLMAQAVYELMKKSGAI